MSSINFDIKDVLEKIRNNEITPEEGFELIKELKSSGAGVGARDSDNEAQTAVFYANDWQLSSNDFEESDAEFSSCMLVFDVDNRLSSTLKDYLERNGHVDTQVLLVKPGREYKELSEWVLEISPSNEEDYAKVTKFLKEKGISFGEIIHGWSKEAFSSNENSLREQLDRSIYSLLFITQQAMKNKRSETVRLVYMYNGGKNLQPQYAAVNGFVKTVHMENPGFIYKAIEFDDLQNSDFTTKIIIRELSALKDSETDIRYAGEERWVRKLKETSSKADDSRAIKLKDDGVYLITGGLGGLGLIFARYIADKVKAKLVLIGRSKLSDDKLEIVHELESKGSEVVYIRADVCQREDVKRVVSLARDMFNDISGIIHSAGVIRDSFVIKKLKEDMELVLSPKVFGTVYLDEETRYDRLDFFAMFSSITSVVGNEGQCDYAYANCFMDNYAELREDLCKQGKRSGRTLSLNWPLWDEGGMQIQQDHREKMLRQLGLETLSRENGLKAWETAFLLDSFQCAVFCGNKRIFERFLKNCLVEKKPTKLKKETPVDTGVLYQKTEQFIRDTISRLIKLPAEMLDPQSNLQDYGIDSIVINNFNSAMEKEVGPFLSKTLLFEFQSVGTLSKYLTENYENELAALFGLGAEKQEEMEPEETYTVEMPFNMEEYIELKSFSESMSPYTESFHSESDNKRYDEGIAIIGVDGRYPFANNLDEFWDNIKLGKDCVTEIPESRWDYREFYDPNPENSKKGKMYSKWGGFIEDVDKFDSLFFNISPKEAEAMDPQERLFLETAWNVLEDAGYSRTSIREYIQKKRTADIGVFVGVTTNQYNLLGPEEWLKENAIIPNAMPWSIPNRVSYVFNFYGPSVPVDTACSSSLTAVHLACESIRKGECHMAIAGGVNLYLHPSKYVYMCQIKMLSKTGKCHSFGEGGDGFVPGEGVGAVLLKPLSAALKDKDHIYGVIKGSSINHGGRTNGYTVPNPNAQAELIIQSLKNAGWSPRTMSYIEAHGTGTALGDPLEITGLTKAFREYTDNTQFCSIGSVKSNIGHLESAAGIAGLTKILLQMKYRQLVPSLHAKKLNPNINFIDSPFYLQQELEEWNKPSVNKDGVRKTYPRRAGISSFGAGGANAHLLIEEYEDAKSEHQKQKDGQYIIVLSARNGDRLKAYAGKLLGFFKKTLSGEGQTDTGKENLKWKVRDELTRKVSEIAAVVENDIREDEDIAEFGLGQIEMSEIAGWIGSCYIVEVDLGLFIQCRNIRLITDYLIKNYKDNIMGYYNDCVYLSSKENKDAEMMDIADIAYTLQVGREAMEERLAVIVDSTEELIEKLELYCCGKTGINGLYTGNIKSAKTITDILGGAEEGKEFIKSVISKRKLDKVAQGWVSGIEIDWSMIYSGSVPKKVSLPTYPFARERHWIKSDWRMSSGLYAKPKEHIREEISSKTEVYYYQNAWIKAVKAEKYSEACTDRHILIFGDSDRVKVELETLLKMDCIFVKNGDSFKILDSRSYEINIDSETDYEKLLGELTDKSIFITEVIFVNMDGRKFVFDSILKAKETAGQDIISKESIPAVYFLFHLVRSITKLKIKSIKQIIYVYKGNEEDDNPLSGVAAAFSRSLNLINPGLGLITVEVADKDPGYREIARIIASELGTTSVSSEIRYISGTRFEKTVAPVELNEVRMKLKNKGVYLITGGIGGLGLIFARYLAVKYNARIILTGRSEMTSRHSEALNELVLLGAEAIYLNADVSNTADMSRVIGKAREIFGSINGIIHAAGLTSEKTLHMKDIDEFKSILRPKIQGTLVLDALTSTEELDFFVLFSSTSSILGDFGQCDYALANRFLDNFADFREALRLKGERHGSTFSINWPLWKEGGMHLNKDGELLYLKSSGMDYLEKEDGIKAFEMILGSSHNQVIVLAGNKNKIEGFLGKPLDNCEDIYSEDNNSDTFVNLTPETILRQVLSDIRKIAADLLMVETNRLDNTENLGTYGFDSISLKDFADALSETFKVDISPTLFFAHSNILAIGNYLTEEYGKEISNYCRQQKLSGKEKKRTCAVNVQIIPNQYIQRFEEKGNRLEERIEKQIERCVDVPAKEDVAIIGISGIFPGSSNVDEFWINLENEKDLITEVPPERWDWRNCYGNPAVEKDKTNSKWGGFIENADKFDPQFFNISPYEAELMDPQQRLFIQTVWKAIEDAGHRISEFSGKRIGVFVGMQFNDYLHLLTKKGRTEAQVATGNAHAMLANRISYLFNFRGPSESIDTACSSSGVAIHRAVKSLQSGESQMAIAGGISLLLSPETVVAAGQMGILSSDGRCKTFDKKANGYVKGEGIGAFVLKPLSRAIADRNHIYAVIKGSAVNHGGKANSLTSPNSEAQAELLLTAYKYAGFAPESVTYIEAHGTGTKLGDPVEFEGLKKAFAELTRESGMATKRQNYCGLGSVKTNIGHLEPASGMAGVMKVILSMKNGKIPGNVHLSEINPYIDIRNTPFYIIDKTREWERLVDESGNLIPRRAGVSSFGFGGANAHIVLEEFNNFEDRNETTPGTPQAILVSAKSENRLKAYLESIKDFVCQKGNTEKLSIADMAYTLQTGRETMDERIAFIVSDFSELLEKISAYCKGEESILGLYKGNVKNTNNRAEDLASASHIGSLERAAELWVSGVEVEWNFWYKDKACKRIPLPTYPFAEESYWIPEEENKNGKSRFEKINTGLHPMIDTNISTLKEQRFSTIITPDKFFIEDHIVDGQKVLPGAAYIEMARAAGEIAAEMGVASLGSISWIRPIEATKSDVEVYTSIYPDADSIEYEIATIGEAGERIIHSYGRLYLDDSMRCNQYEEIVDIETIRKRCTEYVSGQECYKMFDGMALKYGSGFQTIKELRYSETEVLSLLQLPEKYRNISNKVVLHPSLVDGAFQTVIGLMVGIGKGREMLYLPYALGEIEIIKPLCEMCYVYVLKNTEKKSNSDIKKFDILILDKEGQILIKIKDFSIKHFIKNKYNDNEIIDVFQKLEAGELDVEDAGLWMEENAL